MHPFPHEHAMPGRWVSFRAPETRVVIFFLSGPTCSFFPSAVVTLSELFVSDCWRIFSPYPVDITHHASLRRGGARGYQLQATCPLVVRPSLGTFPFFSVVAHVDVIVRQVFLCPYRQTSVSTKPPPASRCKECTTLTEGCTDSPYLFV